MRNAIVMVGVVLIFACQVQAVYIGFEESEGYVNGALYHQPDEYGWQGEQIAYFKVADHGYPNYDSDHLLRVHAALTDGSPEHPYRYAWKRLVPVSGLVQVSYTFLMATGNEAHRSVIAFGKTSDSGWGPYMGLNAEGDERTLKHFDGSVWHPIATGIYTGLPAAFYDVFLDIDLNNNTLDAVVRIHEDGSLFASVSGLPLCSNPGDVPDELAYVMVSNEGTNRPGGAQYYHFYDNLDYVPEPASLTLFGLAGLAILRRRRRA